MSKQNPDAVAQAEAAAKKAEQLVQDLMTKLQRLVDLGREAYTLSRVCSASVPFWMNSPRREPYTNSRKTDPASNTR